MRILENVSLKEYTTFHIGGNADFFVDVHSVAELQEALEYAETHSLTVTVLGGGSNVLVSDDGVRGLVIRICILGIEFETHGNTHVRATVGAGVVWDEFVLETVTAGLWGIENLSAIPGSVGATPVQNVGAYGVEVSSVIDSVDVYDTETMGAKTLTHNECEFGYRSSLFKEDGGKKYIITNVNFMLSKQENPKLTYKDLGAFFKDVPTPSLIDTRNAVISIRSKKFPDLGRVGTAGSFFKNPIIGEEKFETLKITYPELPGFPDQKGNVKIALGWILDKGLSLRGFCEGDVCTYEGQALVIVNKKNATAHDVKIFAEKIQAQVKKVFDISIECEVTFLK